MFIKALKDFKWSFSGVLKSYQKDKIYEVEDKFALQMCQSGYAVKEETKMADIEVDNKMLKIEVDNKSVFKNTNSKKNKKSNEVVDV